MTVLDAGVYRIVVRHANGSSARGAQLIVNVTIVATGALANTGAWTTWKDEVFFNISFNAETNTIRLTATTSGGLANIDRFDISR